MLRLIINEIVKIFKKKYTVVLLVIALLTMLLSYGMTLLVDIAYYDFSTGQSKYAYIDAMLENDNNRLTESTGNTKTLIEERIMLYNYIKDNNIDYGEQYSNYVSVLVTQVENRISYVIDSLDNISDEIPEQVFNKEYETIKKEIDLIKNGSFEDYIAYNKSIIESNYSNEFISEEEYNKQMLIQEENLKYGVVQNENQYYAPSYASYKSILLAENKEIDETLEKGYIISNSFEFINDDIRQDLENDKLINLYRLDNNIPMNYSENLDSTENEFDRYTFDMLSLEISMFVIMILFIIIATASIAEEQSSGTIKFLLLTPFKRYKILLSKLLTYFILLIVITIILSQVSVLIGNILYSNAANEYLYVSNGEVQIMNTNMHMLSRYLLKLPEIIIYILLGVTLSTLFRSVAMANTFTLITYIGIPIAIEIIEAMLNTKIFNYLPFKHFNLANRIIPPGDAYLTAADKLPLSLTYVVLGVTVVLLLITMFESFRKRDIN